MSPLNHFCAEGWHDDCGRARQCDAPARRQNQFQVENFYELPDHFLGISQVSTTASSWATALQKLEIPGTQRILSRNATLEFGKYLT
jgi:hypothetical protein